MSSDNSKTVPEDFTNQEILNYQAIHYADYCMRTGMMLDIFQRSLMVQPWIQPINSYNTNTMNTIVSSNTTSIKKKRRRRRKRKSKKSQVTVNIASTVE